MAYSITRDNASSNDTLISKFTRHYSLNSINFKGDIACCAHVLNLVVQEVLKAALKKDYDLAYSSEVIEAQASRVENEISLEDNNSKLPSLYILY